MQIFGYHAAVATCNMLMDLERMAHILRVCVFSLHDLATALVASLEHALEAKRARK